MKSLKSIFSSCSSLSVSTQKNKRERVKSEHFLRFWNAASFLWIFLNSNEEPARLCSLLCFLSRTKRREKKKQKRRNLLPHRTRSRRLRRRRCRPTASSLSFLSAVSAVPTFVSPDRFWTRFDATDATTSFFLSFDSIRTSTKGKKTIDRWERSLMSLSLFNNKEREREKDVRSVYNKRRAAVIKTFAQQQQKKQQKQRRALCLKCKTHHSRYFFWRRGMKFQKFEPKNCLKMELNSILEWKGKRVLNYCMKLLVLH